MRCSAKRCTADPGSTQVPPPWVPCLHCITSCRSAPGMTTVSAFPGGSLNSQPPPSEDSMKRIPISGPAVEPVSIAEAKAHLRLDGSEDDALVGALVAAARVAVEVEIRQVLVAQGWRVSLDAWP